MAVKAELAELVTASSNFYRPPVFLSKFQSSTRSDVFSLCYSNQVMGDRAFRCKNVESGRPVCQPAFKKSHGCCFYFKVRQLGWDREGGREAQERGDMGTYVYV